MKFFIYFFQNYSRLDCSLSFEPHQFEIVHDTNACIKMTQAGSDPPFVGDNICLGHYDPSKDFLDNLKFCYSQSDSGLTLKKVL